MLLHAPLKLAPIKLIRSNSASLKAAPGNFDINLQIKDLPAGKLAEAQITKYDQQGRPVGGNILIDPDANGKGWFIDPTPFDHSEFNSSLSDTAFRVTTGSAAYSHYDQLSRPAARNGAQGLFHLRLLRL